MIDQSGQGGCNIHGPYEVSGHTTETCLDAAKTEIPGESGGNMPEALVGIGKLVNGKFEKMSARDLVDGLTDADKEEYSVLINQYNEMLKQKYNATQESNFQLKELERSLGVNLSKLQEELPESDQSLVEGLVAQHQEGKISMAERDKRILEALKAPFFGDSAAKKLKKILKDPRMEKVRVADEEAEVYRVRSRALADEIKNDKRFSKLFDIGSGIEGFMKTIGDHPRSLGGDN